MILSVLIGGKAGKVFTEAYASMSQIQLAEMLGVDPSHICRIEKGKGTCSISLLQKLATALGVSVADLLDETPAEAVG